MFPFSAHLKHFGPFLTQVCVRICTPETLGFGGSGCKKGYPGPAWPLSPIKLSGCAAGPEITRSSQAGIYSRPRREITAAGKTALNPSTNIKYESSDGKTSRRPSATITSCSSGVHSPPPCTPRPVFTSSGVHRHLPCTPNETGVTQCVRSEQQGYNPR